MWKEIVIYSLYFNAFLELCLLIYLWKMRGSPYFSFWIPITLAKIFFFPIVVTFAKIHLYEEETVLKHMHKKKEQVHRFSCALYAHAYAYVAGFLTTHTCVSAYAYVLVKSKVSFPRIWRTIFSFTEKTCPFALFSSKFVRYIYLVVTGPFRSSNHCCNHTHRVIKKKIGLCSST